MRLDSVGRNEDVAVEIAANSAHRHDEAITVVVRPSGLSSSDRKRRGLRTPHCFLWRFFGLAPPAQISG